MKKILTIGLFLVCCAAVIAQIVPSNVPTNGLVAYYGFDGNANDLSGNGNNGTLQTFMYNLPSFGTDRYGNANASCQFGGLNDANYVEVPSSSSLQFDSCITLSFWVKQTTPYGPLRDDCGNTITSENTYATIISRGAASECGGEPGMHYMLHHSGTTQTLYAFNNNSTDFASTMFGSGNYNCYSLGEWIHFVVVIDRGLLNIYVNGALILSERPTPNVPTFTEANQRPFYFGITEYYGSGILPFEGAIDDIAIYNRAITKPEVDSLFNNYVDPLNAEPPVSIANIDIINPCGNELGTVTLTPNPIAGVTYQYSATSVLDLQGNNTFKHGPGDVTLYVASSCRQWDTTVTLVCDCADDPTHVDYQSICQGVSGETGSQYESITSHNFDASNDGWTLTSGYWARATGESNYYYLGLPSAYFQAHSGSFALFCSNLQSSASATYFPSTTSKATSAGINIPYDPTLYPITATFWVYSTGFGSSTGGSYYNTLRLYVSTSPMGPWEQVWSISGGGHGSWEQHTVALSSYLTTAGTYYFQIECDGPGYSAGFDDFTITADTRWIIPTEVSQAPAGAELRTEKIRESEGACPITDVTYWTILGGESSDTTIACDSSNWYGSWRYTDTQIDEQTQTVRVATVNNTTCDSTVHHLLTIYSSSEPNVQHITACDTHTVFGIVYETSARIRQESTNEMGCTKIDSVYLTINHSAPYDTTITSCDAITWQGQTINESDTIATVMQTTDGCDSTITLIFHRYHSSVTNITDSFCENSSFRFAGRSLTIGGEYDAHMTNRAGCDSNVHLTLTMLRRPEVELGFDLDCLTKTYVLWGTTNKGTHKWECYPSDPSINDHATDDTLYLADHENYTFVYTAQLDNAPYCPTTKEILLPNIIETKSLFIVQPTYLSTDNLTLHAIDASTSEGNRLWYVDGIEQPGTNNDMYFTASIENDSVLISQIVINGSCYDTSSVAIPIIRNSIFVPNIFTPLLPSNNTEASNSRFRVFSDGIIDFQIHIYNRFGQLVYKSDDINEEWDGTYKGEYCPQGGYSYIIRYRDRITPGDYQVLKGVVTLLH